MENYVQNLIDKVEERLGAAAGMIARVGEEIKVTLDEGDLSAMEGRVQEAREAAGSMILLCDHLAASLEDGSLSATEMGGAALLLNKFLDELEDVATGVDEDDVGEGAGGAED